MSFPGAFFVVAERGPDASVASAALVAEGAERARDICALDESLRAMAATEPRRAQVVEMRFFGGLSVEETAEALQVSPQTVMRDWKLARAWLAVEIGRR